MIRLFHPEPFGPVPGRLTLKGEPFHYLVRVRRAEVGEAIELFDGRGTSVVGKVAGAWEEAVELELEQRRDTAPPRRVTLVHAVAKGDRFEWALEKATELQVSAIQPVITERTVVRIPEARAAERITRWTKIARQAAQQCGRSDVPDIHGPLALLEAARSLQGSHALLVLDEEERLTRLRDACPEGPLAIFVGPEGGFSRSEIAALASASARPVSLGTAILRSETAGLAALCVVRQLDGLLG